MKNHIIKLDDDLALRLGLTSEDFYDAFVWDCRPKYLGVIRLEAKTHAALRNFFELGSKIYSTIVISAPSREVSEMAKEYNYVLKVDKAGVPYLTDESSKILSRQHITELTRKAKR